MPDPGYYQVSVTGSVEYPTTTYSTSQPAYAYFTAVKVDLVWNGDATSDVNSGQVVTGRTFHIIDGMLCDLNAAILPSDALASGRIGACP
jgi:hypothetical protein